MTTLISLSTRIQALIMSMAVGTANAVSHLEAPSMSQRLYLLHGQSGPCFDARARDECWSFHREVTDELSALLKAVSKRIAHGSDYRRPL